MFRKYDTDGSQSISFPEWLKMLQAYALPLSKADAVILFDAFDEEGTGSMSYASFMSVRRSWRTRRWPAAIWPSVPLATVGCQRRHRVHGVDGVRP
jgi:hypothetical protein